LAPQILVAGLIAAGGGAAYGKGAPLWVFYAAIVLAVLSALPGYVRWDNRRQQ
jgi:hypothetical protein